VKVSLRTVALALVAVGLLTCLVPVAVVGYGMWQENQLTQSWSSDGGGQDTATLPLPPFIEEGGSPSPGATTPTPAPTSASHGPQALFAIRVPKIGYYAAVRQGVSLDILATGPGHYPTTAEPGQPGLIGIAAHNTFWIPFGKLGPGDTVVLETHTAKFTYRITGTRIVNPDDRTVLTSTTDPRLVLTTCWPLWAGNLATQRLAIFAQQV
jgi:LPXTG-site transpeptidase (sortase) family protein